MMFIDAVENKMIAVYKDVGECVGHAKTAKMLKYILQTHKIENEMLRRLLMSVSI